MNAKQLMALARDSQKLQLVEIRLLEAHCKLGTLRENSLPSLAKFDTGLGYALDSEKRTVQVIAQFALTSTYEDAAPGSPPAIFASARFGITYLLTKPASKKNLEAAVQHVALINTWPYWRELVQSFTVRMGVPPFPVPLINPQLGKSAKTEPDKTESPKK